MSSASKKVSPPITTAIRRLLEKASATSFPATMPPMLATLVDKAFSKPGWIYEIKWDGYRCIAAIKNGVAELVSRNNKSFNDKFYPVVKELQRWKINAVLDGEIVVLDNNGLPSFNALQNWRSEADGALHYYLFDILWLEGRSLTTLPLTERKTLLSAIAPATGNIRLSDYVDTDGIGFFNEAKAAGLEGIIAKKADSIYREGERSKEWLKIKAAKRQEMVIGGFTKNEDSSKLFSSLLVGVFEGKKLIYTGKVGTGFNDQLQREMMKAFKKRIIHKAPFYEMPDINKPSRFRPDPPHANATWLKPELVCEVSFAELTSDGIMRHPSFEGLRTDKKANMVIMEKAAPSQKMVSKTGAKKVKKVIAKPTGNDRKTLLNPTDETQVRKIKNKEVKFTNLSKIFWPDIKVTKRDMINYYYQVAPYILPYLVDRPQSMNRHPNGIKGESFYYKDITGKAPEWMETFLYHSEADDRDRQYLVPKDEADILYMANLGCIEMNPWHSTTMHKNFPDWCIIDLDPDKNSFDQVIEAALVTKEVLDAAAVDAYAKTSGSTGMHIYIPLGGKYSYEQSKEFARVIAHLVHNELPSFTTIERTVKDRKGKMYIDFLQNRPQATVSAPYSLRPKPGATVSMPLHWSEVKKGLQMKDFNIFNAIERIRSEGDLFKPVLGKGIAMNKALAKLESLVHSKA